MKILADENVDREIVDRLRAQGHDVLYVAEDYAGIDDVLLTATGMVRIEAVAACPWDIVTGRDRRRHECRRGTQGVRAPQSDLGTRVEDAKIARGYADLVTYRERQFAEAVPGDFGVEGNAGVFALQFDANGGAGGGDETYRCHYRPFGKLRQPREVKLGWTHVGSSVE